MRRLSVVRRWVTVALSGLAVAALLLPATALCIQVARLLNLSGSIVRAVHDAVNASPYWSFVTPWTLLHLIVAGLVLSAAAWAAATLNMLMPVRATASVLRHRDVIRFIEVLPFYLLLCRALPKLVGKKGTSLSSGM